MIDFSGFRAEDGSPIYAQLVRYVKRGVVSGAISDGDELPSRRVVSALLGVNPNTVQKAYRALEDEGLIESRAGAKSHVSLTPEKRENVRQYLLSREALAAVRALKGAGLERERALELISQLWDEEAEE